jgi:multidrug resistance efflux pump
MLPKIDSLVSRLKNQLQKIDLKQALSQRPQFTTVMFALGAFIAIGYFLLGVFRFTDNGFVVQISTPLAPRVAGVVQEVHVQNGQRVKAGDTLVVLDPTSYQYSYQSALAQYEKALISLRAMEKKIEVSENSLKGAQASLDILNTQFKAKNHPDVKAGVPQIDMADLKNKIKAHESSVDSMRLQIEIDKLQVQMEQQSIEAMKAMMENARTALEHTTVIAPTDGHIENVFLGIGSHVSPASGMFTLVNDGATYVQANFEETELSGIRAGDKATVYPRTYFGKKSFEGVVVANPFGVSRQTNVPLSGSPFVQTENKWLLLPQRLPVIIKITDTDSKYPLINGMSTYVRLQRQ